MNSNLITAYRKTSYQTDNNEFTILVDLFHPELDRFMIEKKFNNWIFLTAENPYSKKLSKESNKELMRDLESYLTEKQYAYLPGKGIPLDTSWESENSFLIFDIPALEIQHLLEKYQQNACIYGELNQRAQLKLNLRIA